MDQLVETGGGRPRGSHRLEPDRLESNLGALDFAVPADARRRLDEAGATELPKPYSMFAPEYQSWIVSPGLTVGDKPAGYSPPVRNGVSAG